MKTLGSTRHRHQCPRRSRVLTVPHHLLGTWSPDPTRLAGDQKLTLRHKAIEKGRGMCAGSGEGHLLLPENLGHAPYPLWASVSSSAKWGQRRTLRRVLHHTQRWGSTRPTSPLHTAVPLSHPHTWPADGSTSALAAVQIKPCAWYHCPALVLPSLTHRHPPALPSLP